MDAADDHMVGEIFLEVVKAFHKLRREYSH